MNNLAKILQAAMRSPRGTLVLISIMLYLLSIILGMCGCVTPGPGVTPRSPDAGDGPGDGPDTMQKFDEIGHPNFGGVTPRSP